MGPKKAGKKDEKVTYILYLNIIYSLYRLSRKRRRSLPFLSMK